MRTLRRLWRLARLRRIDAELREEIEFHRAMKRQELNEAGVSDQEVDALAARQMGNVTLAREDARAVWLWPAFESMLRDIAYAVRMLRRQPAFAGVAIGILGIGIGLTSSVFAVYESATRRTWPVPDPARVVRAYQVPRQVSPGVGNALGFSIAEARFLDRNTRAFRGIVAMRQGELRFESDAVARLSNAMFVTGNYFRVLGVDMERGRAFIPEEDAAQVTQPVAVLSYLAWQNRFSGDPAIVGRQIRLDDVAVTVVGIAAREFTGTANLRTDVWIPLAALPLLHPLDASVPALLTRPDYCCSAVAGRLVAGVSRDEGRAELSLLSRRFHEQFAGEVHEQSGRDSTAIVLTDSATFSQPGMRAQGRAAFVLMSIGVILILALACANVGNLLIARAAARQREIATRLSIGASRVRIVRQLLTESLVLAFAAAVVGIAMAYVLPSFVLARTGGDPLHLRLRPDIRVLMFSVGLSVLACILSGLAPALHATHISLADAMKQPVFASRLRLRNALLSIQVAASVILLVSAGLMFRGVQHAHALNPGFPFGAIDVVTFDPPASGYNGVRIQALLSDLVAGLAEVPRLTPYGFARTAPFANGHWLTSFRLTGDDAREDMIETQQIAGDYFAVLGIPLVAGRGFEPSDRSRGAIIVNEAMVRRYLGEHHALGQTIVTRTGPREIVGIVKDARTIDLGFIEPLMYEPISGDTMPQLLLRKSSADQILAIAAVANRIDPRIGTRAEPLTAQLERYLSPARTAAVLAGILGMVALALACSGMFGVFAYIVSRRTHEIGIRMALGATPGQILTLVLGASCRPLLVGLVIGILTSAAASQVMRRLLFGLNVFDPPAYAGMCALLGLAAMAATWIPVRRAVRVDPASALHYE